MAHSDITFLAGYDDDGDSNADFGFGNLDSTENGTVSVSNGQLELTSSNSYVEYDGEENIDDLVNNGCVRIVVEPQYDGSPATTQVFFDAFKASGNDENEIKIEHATNGDVNIQLNADDGSTLQSTNLGTFSATSGTTVEFELNFSLKSDEIRLFRDGKQLGTTVGTISKGGRKPSIGLFRLGTNWDATDTEPNFHVKKLTTFEQTQHKSDYTASTDKKQLCFVYSYLKDILANEIDVDQKDIRYAYLKAVNNTAFEHNDDLIVSFERAFDYDERGTAVAQLVETETINESPITFEVVYGLTDGEEQTARFEDAQIPDRDVQSLNTISDLV